MSTGSRPPGTIREVAMISHSAADFGLAYREFLDVFYSNPKLARLAEEPQLLGSTLHDGGWTDAFLAGMAEHLALQHGLPVPAWTRGAERTLDEPAFAFETPEGRMFLLVESPTAFRSRNIFISADALTRA